MEPKVIKNIVIIGSGNIATSLATALHLKKYNIVQVYSSTLEHAMHLALKVDAGYTNNPDELYQQADLYILAVTDNAIETVLKTINFTNKLVIHTSGSTPVSIFGSYAVSYGVVYPLQTFSKSKVISDFSSIPIFVEANSNVVNKILTDFASSLSNNVHTITSKQRLALHVSAVFACNFVNYFIATATDVMYENGLDKEWLATLINETVEKAINVQNPHDVQTGPAIRHDSLTLQRHIDFLKSDTLKLGIYKYISECIMNRDNK